MKTGGRVFFVRAALGCVVALVVFGLGVALIEGGLRLVGFGHPTGFWRKEKDAEGKGWIRENHWVTVPYFAPSLVRRPQAFRLPEKKAPGAYRVFLLGSSAAMGDPEPSFGMARMLERMLKAAYPEIEFEVVNAGVTAINSHVMARIAQDCAELEPDVFIVYEGNNEVIGPYGPGTVFSPFLASSRAVDLSIAFRSLRLGQWLQRVTQPKDTPADWGGMQMFLNHQIGWDDPRLERTYENFRRNLARTVAAGRKAGATVLLSTVLTNQRDFSPFVSAHLPFASEEARVSWETEYKAGLAALALPDPAAAEKLLQRAMALESGYAELSFHLGKAQLAQGKTGEAKQSFQRALDLDHLRFRTDSRLNGIIREVATSMGRGVSLIDSAALAEGASPDGILGNALLYEHVHLNNQGNHVVAAAFFRAISDDLVLKKRISATKPPMPVDEIRRALAVTPYDQTLVIKELLARFSRPPFISQSTNEGRFNELKQREAIAVQRLSAPGMRQAILLGYEEAISQAPWDWVLLRNAGMAAVALGDPAKGRDYLERAKRIIPDDADLLRTLESLETQQAPKL